MSKFAIGIDPGIKYTGIAYGCYPECRGIQLDLHPRFSSVISIVEQHWDLIQWVDYYYRDTGTACEIYLEVPGDLSHLGEDDQSTENLRILSEVCNELENRLAKLTENNSEYSYFICDGADTSARRKKLGIRKTPDKFKKNIMAHINDARAIWTMCFFDVVDERNRLLDLIEDPEYCVYEEWNRLIIDDFLDEFKKRVIDGNIIKRSTNSIEVVDGELLKLCTNKNACKADILEYIEILETKAKTKSDAVRPNKAQTKVKIEDTLRSSRCYWAKTRYSNIFYNTGCSKVLKYNSTHTACPGCSRQVQWMTK